MPEVIFPGPEGRLEGRYQPASRARAPVAIILQPHPQQGTMNHPIAMALTVPQTVMVFLSLLVASINIHDGETNAIEGLTHFVLFAAFLMLSSMGI